MKVNCKELLAQAKKDSQQIIQVAKESFGSLSDEKLYWKPAPDKWSVGECIEHLNITIRSYLPKIDQGIEQGIAKGQTPTEMFQPGFLGQKFTDSFRLNEDGTPYRKVKTFKSFDSGKLPEPNPRAREEFTELLEAFIAQIDKAAQVNLNKVKVTSAIGAIFRFKLGDAFRFITVHNDRHMVQAQKVLEAMAEKVS